MDEKQFDAAVSKILSGNKEGLKDIYETYGSYIYRIILGIVGRKEDAEDLTGDFFIKLYGCISGYKSGSGHKGYIATIARNMALDFLRKNKREMLQSFSEPEDDNEPAVQYADTVNVEESVINELSLKEALDSLNEKERRIVDMKILSDMTFKEISEALIKPIGTVTWLYREAINKLRRCGFDERSV